MSQQWPGGLIRKTPPTPTGPYQDGTAPGVWTLDQMNYWLKQGLWPIAGNINTSNRGVFGGGYTPTTNVIQYVDIGTTGNTTDFGDLVDTNAQVAGCGSTTRGIFAGGYNNVIQYITFATTGNATNFGQLSGGASEWPSALANSTRAVFGGRDFSGTRSNIIDYITIANTSNATDFGDLTAASYAKGGLASPTRGLFLGGYTNGDSNTIDYVTIATTGNATDFGDTAITESNGIIGPLVASSSTRGVIAGCAATAFQNVIQYVTIATTGNSLDFGDLTVGRQSGAGCSTNVRAIFGGGINSSSTRFNTIDYVTIATTGNATDFGDLASALYILGACSGASGGVQ